MARKVSSKPPLLPSPHSPHSEPSGLPFFSSPELLSEESSANHQYVTQKPNSGKARKTQLQTSRAIKAQTKVPTPHPLDALELATRSANSTPLVLPTSSRPSGVQRFRTVDESARDSRKDASLKLESRFLRLPLDLLQHHRLISATAPLVRRKLWRSA